MITITYTEYTKPIAYLPNVVYNHVVKNFSKHIGDKAEKLIEKHWDMSLEKLSLGNCVNVLEDIRIIG